MYKLSYLGHSVCLDDLVRIDGDPAVVCGFIPVDGELPLIRLRKLGMSREISRKFNDIVDGAPNAPYGGVSVDEFTGKVSINGEYGYAGHFTSSYVCYTCGVLCECGDSDE